MSFALKEGRGEKITGQDPENILNQKSQRELGAAIMNQALTFSIITWGELLYIAEKSTRKIDVLAILNEFSIHVPVLSMPEHAGETYGSIRAYLESQGKPIGSNDMWIAAHAKAEDLTLVTNNEREFSRIPGLKVEN